MAADQWRLFKLDASYAQRPGSGTEINPGGRHSDTRIILLPLTYGHGRYITVTPERTLVSVGEWPLHEPPPGSRSGLKRSLGLLESSICNSFSRRRR
jgi:hypothetical protein